MRALKPTGTFWLAIGDDFAAELKLMFQRGAGPVLPKLGDLVLHVRRELQIQIQPQPHASVSFREGPEEFHVQHARAIRVPSARQLVYADSRADPAAGFPMTPGFFARRNAPTVSPPEEDTWYVPRVCGTFKERAGWHGCQMPEQILGRIIKACSNRANTVLDPFGGSGTTLVGRPRSWNGGSSGSSCRRTTPSKSSSAWRPHIPATRYPAPRQG